MHKSQKSDKKKHQLFYSYIVENNNKLGECEVFIVGGNTDLSDNYNRRYGYAPSKNFCCSFLQ